MEDGELKILLNAVNLVMEELKQKPSTVIILRLQMVGTTANVIPKKFYQKVLPKKFIVMGSQRQYKKHVMKTHAQVGEYSIIIDNADNKPNEKRVYL